MPNLDNRTSFALLIGVAVLTMILAHVPILSLILLPLKYFTTGLHELGHAIACSTTGGSVSGLTIVGDGQGHAGLTFCRGGISFITIQAGYLATMVFGCLLLWICSYENQARNTLYLLAAIVIVAVLFFMPGTIAIKGHRIQAVLSMLLGTIGAISMFYVAKFARYSVVRFLVLLLAVQTALDALSDISLLALLSLGFIRGGTTDATIMANLTGIPAILWSLFWGALSVGLLYLTVKKVYWSQVRLERTQVR